jgi:ATP-binding cassette subfamily C protein
LLGLEKAAAGSVLFDGRNLDGLDLPSLRRQVGVVMQSPRVAAGSIYDNIAFGNLITMDQAMEAARSAGMAEDIARMPMGMQTLVSEGGGNLSGGQRQRLMIARAMAGNPRLVIFDEATSALDNITQEIVSRSLEAMKVTRVTVAHRLSTIRRADVIYVMDGGRIVDSGSFEELMGREGLFRSMAARQIA